MRLDWVKLDWLLSPLGLYTILALALFGCLALFLSMKREIAVVRRSLALSRDEAAASQATVNSQLVELQQRAGNPEESALPGHELNLTRRAQALKMQHRGESPATIASALRVPRNEIDLLLKIQEFGQVYDR